MKNRHHLTARGLVYAVFLSSYVSAIPAHALIANATPSKIAILAPEQQQLGAEARQEEQVAAAVTTVSTNTQAAPVTIVRHPTPSKVAISFEFVSTAAITPTPESIPMLEGNLVASSAIAPAHASARAQIDEAAQQPIPSPQAVPVSRDASPQTQTAILSGHLSPSAAIGFIDTDDRSSIALPLDAPVINVPAPGTPSKVAVAAPAHATEPNHIITDNAQQHGLAALNAYLSTPSKTPVAALQAFTTGENKQAVEITASSVLIVDQDSGEVLFSKSAQDIVPIASITKLMTAMVVLDAGQPMTEKLTITQADVDTLKNSPSRLTVGTRLTRREMLHLALMSSENRAAHALARNYPGGIKAFINAMNAKARTLGMTQTHYVDPTGLSNLNRSSARDLVWLVKAAYNYQPIRNWSTSSGYKVSLGRQQLRYINSNRLTDRSNWQIGLQKTGYIRESGHCMVLQTAISGRRLIMVLLDANGSAGRLADAEALRTWVMTQNSQYAGR